MELHSTTQEQAGNSLDAKQVRVSRADHPWYPQAKLLIRRSMTMNFPKDQRILMLSHCCLGGPSRMHLLPFWSSAGCTTLVTQSLSSSQCWFWSPRSSIASSGTEPVSCSQGSRWYMSTFLLLLSAPSTRNPWNQGAQLQSWSCLTVRHETQATKYFHRI